jgi:glycosidase
LFDHYRQLISLRRSTPALRRSPRSRARAWAEGNVICLVRSHDDGDVVILYNVGPSKESGSLPDHRSWRDLLATTDAEVPAGVVTVDPWGYRIFRSTVTG